MSKPNVSSQCPVCLEQFNDGDNMPMVSACGHTFCNGCVDLARSSAATKKAAGRGNGTVECALCRHPQKTFAKNFELLNILSAIRAVEQGAQSSENKASASAPSASAPSASAPSVSPEDIDTDLGSLFISSDRLELDWSQKTSLGRSERPVHRAKLDGESVVVKAFPMAEVSPKYTDSKKNLLEASRLRSPSIVHLLGVSSLDSKFLVVTELMGGSLRDAIDRAGGPLSPAVGLRIMLQVVRGLNVMHSRSLFHGNLKTSNILLSNPDKVQDDSNCEQLQAKIGDFCLILSGSVDGDFSDLGVRYMAPELFKEHALKADRFKTDVYSLGVILWEISVGGKRPWNDMQLEQVYHSVCVENRRPGNASDAVHVRGYPNGFDKIIEACWSESPDKRPLVANVLKLLNALAARNVVSDVDSVLCPEGKENTSPQTVESKTKDRARGERGADAGDGAAGAHPRGVPGVVVHGPVPAQPVSSASVLSPAVATAGTESRTNPLPQYPPSSFVVSPVATPVPRAATQVLPPLIPVVATGGQEIAQQITRGNHTPSQLLSFLNNPLYVNDATIQGTVCVMMSRSAVLKKPNDPEKKKAVSQGLVRVVTEVIKRWHGYPLIVGPCLLSLANTLAGDDSSRDAFCQVQGVEVLESIMREHERVPDIQEKCCYLLGLLAGFTGPSCCARCGGLSKEKGTFWVDSPQCKSFKIVDRCYNRGMTSLVVSAMQINYRADGVLVQGLYALRNLCLRYPLNADVAGTCGAINLIQYLIQNHIHMKDRLLEGIAALLSGRQNQAAVLSREPILQFLSGTMKSFEEILDKQTVALYAILGLVEQSNCESAVMRYHFVDRIAASMSRHRDSWKLQEVALRCMWQMSERGKAISAKLREKKIFDLVCAAVSTNSKIVEVVVPGVRLLPSVVDSRQQKRAAEKLIKSTMSLHRDNSKVVQACKSSL